MPTASEKKIGQSERNGSQLKSGCMRYMPTRDSPFCIEITRPRSTQSLCSAYRLRFAAQMPAPKQPTTKSARTTRNKQRCGGRQRRDKAPGGSSASGTPAPSGSRNCSSSHVVMLESDDDL